MNKGSLLCGMNKFLSDRQSLYVKHAILLCGILAGSLGCSSTPVTHYYTLHGATEVTPLVDSPPSYSVGVGPIMLPELLIHPGVVNYSNTQKVTVPLYHIWAGSLAESVSRVVADDLSSLLKHDDVWPFPWDNRARPERQVRIVIEELGGVRGGDVILKAKWRVVELNGEKVLDAHRVEFNIATSGSSYDRYAQAINVAINRLSSEIALSILAAK